MTLRDNLLPVADRARAIAPALGFRPVRVVIRTRTWSSGVVRLGEVTETDLELSPRPRVRTAGLRSVIVGPITPEYSGGGYEPDQLLAPDTAGSEQVWVLTGPDNVERSYRVSSVESRKALGYTLTLELLDRIEPEF